MNKKIALILTLIITSTTTLFGCGAKIKTEEPSASDTTVQESIVEEEASTADSTDVSDKTEDTSSKKIDSNETQSSNEKTTQDNKVTSTKTDNKNQSSETASSTKNEDTATSKKDSGKSTTYTAKAGYNLTFPANWEGKYIIEDTTDTLTISYKCSKDKNAGNPYLFSIEKAEIIESDLDHFDTVGDIRSFNVGDTKYYVGGPTGLTLDPSSEDFSEFSILNKERKDVVNSITVVK